MKLSQVQQTQQKLSMTATMRNSLMLLHLGSEGVVEAVEEERQRNPFLQYVPLGATGGGAPAAGGDGAMGREVAHAETITDTLLHQIGLIAFSPAHERLARQMPFCLDERGFIADPQDELCRYLKADAEDITSVVSMLQASVEPVGVFAWSLKDCFRIQLEALNRCDPLILQLLDRLDLVARQDHTGISALCGVDLEDAEDMVADIRRLRPAPLAPETPLDQVPSLPELRICDDGQGALRVALNENAVPKLLADDGLFSRIGTVEVDDDALQYYRDCYRGAASYVAAMQKRANTLLRIGQEIAAAQAKFIATGRVIDRKPLTMRNVAETLGLNKSTISRALHNCRIETDRGVVAAADFFSRPLSDKGTSRTRDQALQRLSILIRAEDKQAPHSDQALAELLDKANLPISRRTVAKYRGLLDIPGAYERRERRRR